MFVNPNIPLVDSNVLISYLTKDKYFDKAKTAISKGCYYNEFILCEVLNFIQNKYGQTQSILVHDIIFNKPNQFQFLATNYELQIIARDIRQIFKDNNFSFTDSIILAQGKFHKLLVYTDDDKMANYKKVRVINPNY